MISFNSYAMIQWKARLRRSIAACMCVLLVGVLPLTAGVAETFQPINPLPSTAPALTNEGFLASDAENAYYLSMDQENGEWTYIDSSIFIHINRFTTVIPQKNKNLVWYETEIRTTPDVKLTTKHANPEQIGRKFVKADTLAQQTQSVLAFSDDFFAYRVYRKLTPGIVIQDGVILSTKTKNRSLDALPTYDLMALYADGSMKTWYAGSVKAEELLEQHATDVWCFGPILLSEGQLGQQLLKGKFENANPRQCLGMIEPYHYLLITVEGRTERSFGVGLRWIAEQMQQLGCTEAINLDGGKSVQLLLMGQLINSESGHSDEDSRSVSSLITLGTIPEGALPQQPQAESDAD